ncbi:phosphohydrolase, partial [Flavobacteriaceae bacterium]|nr:phosphohydrolase [Flavobacteriaceae bacterium]
MKKTLSTLSRNQSLLYKGFLFIAATFLILYLFPKAGQFKYDFQKGKPWQYENLYAPFSFTIKKDAVSLASEKDQIVNNAVPYFNMDMAIVTTVTKEFYRLLDEAYQNSLFRVPKLSIQSKGAAIIDQIYKHGIVNELYSYDPDKLVYLK